MKKSSSALGGHGGGEGHGGGGGQGHLGEPSSGQHMSKLHPPISLPFFNFRTATSLSLVSGECPVQISP
jgi:hypothetical protein